MFIRSGYSAHTRSARSRGSAAVVRSCTKHHHRAARVLLGAGHLAAWLGAQTNLHRLALEALNADAVELDHAALWIVAGSDQALAFDQNCSSAHAHSRGAAYITKPSHAGRLGRRRGVPAGAIEWLEGRDDRGGEQTAGAQVRTRAAQERQSPSGAAEKLD